jgi:hypothetical protein
MGTKERTTYRAAKHAAKATSFGPSFLKAGILDHRSCGVQKSNYPVSFINEVTCVAQ